MTIFVGTASWTDPTLIASRRFYPAGCTSAEARLRFYATQFPLVEVDSSYYAMPSASNSVLWVERTPAHFTFNVKAFRLFTGHQTDRAKLPKDIQAALPASDKKTCTTRTHRESFCASFGVDTLRRLSRYGGRGSWAPFISSLRRGW